MPLYFERTNAAHPGTSAMSALEATRRPAGHRSVISACSSLSRYAAAADPAVAVSPTTEAVVDGGVSSDSGSSQLCARPSGDALAMAYDGDDGDDDVVDHDERDADGGDGRFRDGFGVPPGNCQECPIRPGRGDRPPFCSRAANFFFLVAGVFVASAFQYRQVGYQRN